MKYARLVRCSKATALILLFVSVYNLAMVYMSENCSREHTQTRHKAVEVVENIELVEPLVEEVNVFIIVCVSNSTNYVRSSPNVLLSSHPRLL